MKRQEHAYFVRGDNDSWDVYERFRHLAREDTTTQYQFVTQLPTRIVLELQGITFLLQHGYLSLPIREQGFTEAAVHETLARPYVESVVSFEGVDVACFGDLDRPSLEFHSDLVLGHPGSVGAPRDQQPWTAKYCPSTSRDRRFSSGRGAFLSVARRPFRRCVLASKKIQGRMFGWPAG